MFSNVCNEIKKKCFSNQKQIQPLSEKLIESIQESIQEPIFVQEYRSVQVPLPIQEPKKIKNKLITCYEEDYTRNANEIMKYWQRN
jgi:ribosomal protein S13